MCATNNGCSGLTSVVIPNSVTSIGSDAFYYCEGLTSVTIGNSVTRIGNEAFRGCYGLTSITIPNSVTSIGNHTFEWCRGLTSVTIGNSVMSIGEDVFRGCNNVKELIYADGCNTTLRTYLTSIERVIIPNSVTSIGEYAFYKCSALTSVTIPNSVISIEDYAFSDCFGLISVTIGNSVTNIGDFAFDDCSGLTSVTIPNSVTSIGSMAFYYCSGLTSITIPNSVTSIGYMTFEGCSGLTSITIPNSVTSIGNCAFRYCSKLKEIHSQAITPPTACNETFDGVSTNCKLYVPIGTKEDYAFAKGWNVFMNIIEESIISDGDNKCDAPTIEFIDGHLKFSSATPNATFSYTITDEDIKTSLQECVSGDLPLTATYNITVYAFAEGYDASNATTATLHWIDGTLSSADGIKSIGTKRAVLVSSRDGKVKTSGLSDGEKVEAYTIDGKYIGCAYAVDDAAYISAQSGEVVVLKIGKESIKTIVK